MKNYVFLSLDEFDTKVLTSSEHLISICPDFQTVAFRDEDELFLLLELFGIQKRIEKSLSGEEFLRYWDISENKFPEFTDESEYDSFYEQWLEISARDNNMDEYGSLIFLRGLSKKWNERRFRLILEEY